MTLFVGRLHQDGTFGQQPDAADVQLQHSEDAASECPFNAPTCTKKVITDPDELVTKAWVTQDQSTLVELPDGTKMEYKAAPDGNRFGTDSAFVGDLTIKNPADATIATITHNRTVVLSDPADPTTLQSQTDTYNYGGMSLERVYTVNAASDDKITTTRGGPGGYTTETYVNDKGQRTKSVVPGATDVLYTYTTNGRIETVTQGTRGVTYGYDGTTGFLQQVTVEAGALDLVFSYERDNVGRVTKVTYPDACSRRCPTTPTATATA